MRSTPSQTSQTAGSNYGTAPTRRRRIASTAASFAAITALFLTTACVQTEFFGTPHEPPAESIAALYESVDDIDRPHETFGRLITTERFADRQGVIDATRREAARRGANAIVILDIERAPDTDHQELSTAPDPITSPLRQAVDSKIRWRVEALLIRWQEPPSIGPDTGPPSPAPTSNAP
ncbi:MAG: hypothetical protein ACTS3F_01570 [Phycisphaerales bacterium]